MYIYLNFDNIPFSSPQEMINTQIIVMKDFKIRALHPCWGRRWMDGWMVCACSELPVSNVSKLTYHLFLELTGTGTPQKGFHSLIPEWLKNWSMVPWWRCSYLQSRPGYGGSREGTSDWMNHFKILASQNGARYLKHLFSKQVVPHFPLDIPADQITLKWNGRKLTW